MDRPSYNIFMVYLFIFVTVFAYGWLAPAVYRIVVSVWVWISYNGTGGMMFDEMILISGLIILYEMYLFLKKVLPWNF